MRIEKTRSKRADDVTANLESLMNRRRLVHRTGDRLEILRIESERIQITIPANCIEGMMRQRHAREAWTVFHQNIDIFFLVDCHQLSRRVQIALRIGRAHFDLPLVIQITLWDANWTGRFEN